MAEEQKIVLRTVEDKDLGKLPEFLSEGFPDSPIGLWKSRFAMWWEENPFMNISIPKGWILEKDGSEIVGFLGNIPLKYRINGKIGNAVASSSWYVRPEFQGIWGVRLMYAFLKQADADLFLNTTPMENVEKTIKKLGFSSLELPFNYKEFWHIIDYNKVFDLLTNKLGKSHKFLIPFLKIISLKLKIFSHLERGYKKKQGNKIGHNDYVCSVCTHCDDSFTKLWEKNANENATTLNRDAATLNWLYFADAVRKKRHVIKCTKMPGDKLVGYMAYDLNFYPERDLKILKLKDVYLPEINASIIYAFLSFSLDLAKKLKASGLRLWATNPAMEKTLKKKMKIRRKFSLPYYYRLDNNLELGIKNNKNHEFIPSPIDPNRGNL